MFVDTFIGRPILASVCSLVIILAGVIAIPTLPISLFPDLAPPTVQVTAFYNGASAQTVETAEAVASGERGLASVQAAANQAQQVVTITNVSFRAGAVTNIEVIDAERSARDADTAVAVAEDTLRRARLALLLALGRFP